MDEGFSLASGGMHRNISRRDVLKGGVVADLSIASTRLSSAETETTGRAKRGDSPVKVMLRCEYLHEPLGMQNQNPRLSWSYSGVHADVRQLAYQIIVSPKQTGTPHLWNSGRVKSTAVAASYEGKRFGLHRIAY